VALKVPLKLAVVEAVALRPKVEALRPKVLLPAGNNR
jgi:hypothetical protein